MEVFTPVAASDRVINGAETMAVASLKELLSLWTWTLLKEGKRMRISLTTVF